MPNRLTQLVFGELVRRGPILAAAAAVEFHPNPIYGAVWALTTTYLAMMQAGEREAFASEFGKKEVADEVLNSVEFARAAKAAVEAASNTASEEKIRMLARLLYNGANSGLVRDYDVFKEYTKLVDDVSPQEFRILTLMDHHMEAGGLFGVIRPPQTRADEEKFGRMRRAADELEITTAAIGDVPQKRMSTLDYNWRTAEGRIKSELDISTEALQSYMLRLERTGCVAPVAIPMYEGVRTIHRVTPLYFSLKDFVRREAGQALAD